MSTTDPTAKTLPNPYRFTVEVFRLPYFLSGAKETWTVVLHLGNEWSDALTDDFPTKEEADTHAALILSALHQAVME